MHGFEDEAHLHATGIEADLHQEVEEGLEPLELLEVIVRVFGAPIMVHYFI